MTTPGGLVDKQELIDAQLDTAHLGRVVNSKDASGAPISTSTNRTGGVNKTLDALEKEYLDAIQGAGGVTVGTWTAGVTTFNAFNEYAVFNGIPYKPRTTTTFPYVAQGADPTVAPDDANVQPYTDVTREEVETYVQKVTNLQAESVADMMIGKTVGNQTVLIEDGQIWETLSYNVPVTSKWEVTTALGVDDFGVAVTGGLFAKLIVGDVVNPKEFGLYIDDTNIDDWTEVLNFVYPSTPTYTLGGVDYYKARYPIKFLGTSLIDKTQVQNKITVSPTIYVPGISISGPECGLAYAVAKGLGVEHPMLASFRLIDGLPDETPALLIDHCPSHYLGFFGVKGEEGKSIGIRRILSANGRLDCLDLSHHKTGMRNEDSGITRATRVSASFCTAGGVRNITSGDSDWLQCYFNTNNVDYAGLDFITGSGITFESQSSNCNLIGGKAEYNAKGVVVIDSCGINLNGTSYDANRMGNIHLYNTVASATPSDANALALKSINIVGNRLLSGGQAAGDGGSGILIQTHDNLDVNISGNSHRRGGTLAFDDNPGDATRPVGPLQAGILLKFIGSDIRELNLTLNGDFRRCSENFTLQAVSTGPAAALNLHGNPNRDLPNNFFGLTVENGITLESKGVVTNNGASATIAGQTNIASVVRTGLGDVFVTFKVPYDDTSYTVIPHSLNTGFVVEAFKSTGNITFKTRNISDTPIDANFGFICK